MSNQSFYKLQSSGLVPEGLAKACLPSSSLQHVAIQDTKRNQFLQHYVLCTHKHLMHIHKAHLPSWKAEKSKACSNIQRNGNVPFSTQEAAFNKRTLLSLLSPEGGEERLALSLWVCARLPLRMIKPLQRAPRSNPSPQLLFEGSSWMVGSRAGGQMLVPAWAHKPNFCPINCRHIRALGRALGTATER